METKVCRKCGEELPVDDFCFDNKEKTRRRNDCRKCQRLFKSFWYWQNREKVSKYEAARHALNTDVRQ